jgi:hypothetical protein
MITMKCDKTGIEFEADSKRQKNHPLVSALLNAAAKDKYNNGLYKAAIEAFEEVKATGGYTIEEAISYAEAAMQGKTEQGNEKRRIEAERNKRIAEAKAHRRATNNYLYANGYRWYKEDEESMDAFGANAFEEVYGSVVSVVWTLISPDGRAVTVAQALEEIKAK